MDVSLKRLMTKLSLKLKKLKYASSGRDAFRAYFKSDDYRIHENYRNRGIDRTSEAIGNIISSHVDHGGRVLEVGCNVGRHLAHLHGQGYENLYGIEINEDAIEALRSEYPKLYEDATIYTDAVEERLPEFPDDYFDATFSATVLQHIRDGESTMDEIARTTSGIVITLELEEPINDYWHYRYRSYREEFESRGFEQIRAWEPSEAPFAESLKDRPHYLRLFEKVDG